MSTFASTKIKAPPRLVFAARSEADVMDGAVLLYGEREERSHLDAGFVSKFSSNPVHQLVEADQYGFMVDDAFENVPISLRDTRAMRRWAANIAGRPVYLDITGLSHQIWMPVLRLVIEVCSQVFCIYAEPENYKASPNPRPGEFYDLSEKVRGLFPIPSFARIPPRRSAAPILVPLLGFEGPRFRFLIESLEPNERDVIPIVGVPGFEIDYPFQTYEGNSEVLSDSRSWHRIYYVDAACPFALYEFLRDLRARTPDRPLQLAAIGTKPHALGALLFAVCNDNCEILHDHPIRKENRTSGTAKCHLYDISSFLTRGQ